MMDAESVACTLVAKALGLETVRAEDAMHSLGGWDSLGHLAIVTEIETHTGAALSPEQIVSITSVRDVAQLLSRED
jgi:acyl carrier protein